MDKTQLYSMEVVGKGNNFTPIDTDHQLTAFLDRFSASSKRGGIFASCLRPPTPNSGDEELAAEEKVAVFLRLGVDVGRGGSRSAVSEKDRDIDETLALKTLQAAEQNENSAMLKRIRAEALSPQIDSRLRCDSGNDSVDDAKRVLVAITLVGACD